MKELLRVGRSLLPGEKIFTYFLLCSNAVVIGDTQKGPSLLPEEQIMTLFLLCCRVVVVNKKAVFVVVCCVT